MSSLHISAQPVHEFSGYVGGGLSALCYQLSSGDRSGGFGGEFGAGYTYLNFRNQAVETGTTVLQQWWGIHAGIGFGFYNAKAKLNNVEAVTANLIDDEGDRFDLYSTLSGYNETQRTMFLNIPVMGQYNIDQFYVMGGIKTSIPLNGKYKSKGTLTNEGYYHEWEVLTKVPEFRGFGNFNRSYSGDIDLGVSVALALEAGMHWSLSDNLVLYGGAYFDYGLNNVAKGSKSKFINPDVFTTGNAENFTAKSVLSSYAEGVKSTPFTDKVNTMAVGIKVRVAFRK
jgi:hypothetical protein